ncbi:MAG: hypothetical protein ABFS14_13400 [Gemmatimonadota bacterium]
MDEIKVLETGLAAFLDGWAAHGEALAAGFCVLEGRFLLIAVDEAAAGASGCSIDALTGELRRLQDMLETDLLSGNTVWYRSEHGQVVSCDRQGFRDRSAAGDVSSSTIVFDHTLTRLKDYPVRWEVPAGACWHSTLLSAAEAREEASE